MRITSVHIPVALLGLLATSFAVSGQRAGEAPGFVYLNDPDDGDIATVTLARLGEDASRLQGRYARVSSNRLDFDGEPAPGLDGQADFRYPPKTDPAQDCIWQQEDCSYFDAVNVYYHIDRFATEFWRDRLGIEADFQAFAVTHVAGGGAFAIPEDRTIKFGFGNTFMKNAALEDEVIYHEYTHLVTHRLGFEVGIESPSETRALNEGIAHYFAASYTDDPRFGEWIIRCPDRRHCTGPPNDEELLTLDTNPREWNWNDGSPASTLKYGVCTRYHEGDGKCKTSYNNFDLRYVWGMIWGSALWDLRAELGASIADTLVLQGLLRSARPDLTFEAAAQGIMEADADLFGGRYARIIAGTFRSRGIGTTGTSLKKEAPAESSETIIRLEQNYPNPFKSETALRFSLAQPAAVSLRIFDMTGRALEHLFEGRLASGTHRVV